jgi:hypothetical protein
MLLLEKPIRFLPGRYVFIGSCMERLSQKQFGILGELLFRLGIHLGNPRLKGKSHHD